MSSKIYFKEKSQRRLSWYLIRIITSSMKLLPKKQRNRMVANLLLKPVRATKDVPIKISQDFLQTPYGRVAIYCVGDGPIVLMSHGWSGSASQLFGLMRDIAAQGYRAIAIDHIGHGASAGKLANLFLFVRTLEFVIQHLEKNEKITALVAHSMGAPAILSAIKRTYPTLLIAPVFEFAKSLFSKVEESGLPRSLLLDMLDDLEARYGLNLSQCDPKKHIVKHASDTYIIHDHDDVYSPIEDSVSLAEKHEQIVLRKTRNLGHGRIISSDETMQLFEEMMREWNEVDICSEARVVQG